MSVFTTIENKLLGFIKKYYLNKLIRGSILFISLGILYLFITLFIEHFLWLTPNYRTLLFWIFILVELLLLFRFICFPLFQLFGLQKGISKEEASKIIGNHFPEVKDKLTNILQLKNSSEQSDLLLASIEQKSEELQPIPFSNAIDYKVNKKYLKYALIPLLVWGISLFTGVQSKLSNSLERIVNHKTAYIPPAPFSLLITNDKLDVILGNSITIYIEAKGEVIPEEAKILFNDQEYYMQNEGRGLFSYTFNDVRKPITFSTIANKVTSPSYQINVIKTPSIKNIEMFLQYPAYTQRKNEVLKSSGNTIVPQGTLIKWTIKTTDTDSVNFNSNQKKEIFKQENNNQFSYSKRIHNPTSYTISTSNKSLKDYENLQFSIDVIKDENPTISVKSNIDSISRGPVQFAGQISDDYGFQKLELVYYDQNTPEIQKTHALGINKENIQTFFYQFPDGIELEKGINYELFFRVFDNDRVNGNKKAESKKFSYRKKTEQEVEEELLNEQKDYIENLENSIEKQQQNKKALEKFQFDIQNKKNVNWNDQKKIQNLIKRQKQYEQMMHRQTEKLKENLTEKKEATKELQEQKDELKKRLEELKKLEKQQKLLEELNKLAEKLNKEDLLKKAKELAQQNKQKEQSLERILEMTKRFYIEQKATQISENLKKLAEKQQKLTEKNSTKEEQKDINKEFDKTKKDLESLKKDNKNLKTPMELPSMENLKKETQKALNKAEENLSNQQQSAAKKSQKKAAQKMQEMSQKMKKSMQMMSANMEQENIEGLRQIVKNLITYSFDQEKLMNRFESSDASHPDFGSNLKKQHQLKTYFEHIDDSLFVISIKVPKISSKIQEHLGNAHYNIDQSLENFADNKFRNGTKNQQYVLTAVNSLAHMLSNTLDAMQNPKPGSGKGKGKGESFSLPDIIQKQGELLKKMQQGLKQQQGRNGKQQQGNKKDGEKGKNGKKGGNGEEQMSGELFEIFKQQSELKQQLEDALKQVGTKSGEGKKALKQIEDLENEILEKGFNRETINRMQQLNYELLKLEKATFEQNKDKKRKANTNLKEYQKENPKQLQFKKLFYQQTEILNRQSLPLRQNYKKKVQEYFNTSKSQ